MPVRNSFENNRNTSSETPSWTSPCAVMATFSATSAGCADAGRWENLVSQAPGFPPPYRVAPGDTVYQVSVGEQTVMVAEDDLTGPLRDLVMAVLAEGDEF